MVQDIKQIEGELVVRSQRFVIVVSRFNQLITEGLLNGAIDTLKRHGAAESQITVVHVPGAYELPLAVSRLAKQKHYDAIIALGAVIRGDTPHFDYVCKSCVQGINQVMMEFDVPVSFGVLTTDTLAQALERAGSKAGNKGVDAALCAIEMVNVLAKL